MLGSTRQGILDKDKDFVCSSCIELNSDILLNNMAMFCKKQKPNMIRTFKILDPQ